MWEQVWFPGVHALTAPRGARPARIQPQWTIDSRPAAGLHLREDVQPPSDPTIRAGTLHEPLHTWKGWVLKLLSPVGSPWQDPTGALLHQSVADRHEATGYHPEVLPERYTLVD
ncbi:MAG: hypothetical protein U5L11_03410 [Arhodomonas sp.]|nr:hypothetical protein [Arhodomonas sp.]